MPDPESEPLSSASGVPIPPATIAGPSADPLASLKKMSTTAGVGTGEYVAINPVAIVALLLGLASALVLLSDVMLIVPLAGIVCALIAWRQVRTSSGTQTGTALAVAGLALSLLLGGGVFARRVVIGWARHGDEQAMAAVVERLGQDLSTGRYDEAYDLFGQRFKARITAEKFRATLEERRRTWEVGGIRSLEWNGRAEFPDDTPGSAADAAWVGILVRFEKPLEMPLRNQMQLVRAGDNWVIEDWLEAFPTEQRGRKTR